MLRCTVSGKMQLQIYVVVECTVVLVDGSEIPRLQIPFDCGTFRLGLTVFGSLSAIGAVIGHHPGAAHIVSQHQSRQLIAN
jgi:hypothetical protein